VAQYSEIRIDRKPHHREISFEKEGHILVLYMGLPMAPDLGLFFKSSMFTVVISYKRLILINSGKNHVLSDGTPFP